jgi:hypothetical protein
MIKLLTFFKTQNPCREGQGHAGGWLEARVWTRCHAKDPLDASAVTSFVQARFLSIVRALCTTLALGVVAFGVCSPSLAGPYFPAISLHDTGEVNTANFGATAYAEAVPAGFGNWVTAIRHEPNPANPISSMGSVGGLNER